MFLLCPHFGSLWPLVQTWIAVDGVEIQVIQDQLNHFIYYTGGLKAQRNFLHLIWFLCYGFCGLKEIISCLKIRNAIVISYLKK